MEYIRDKNQVSNRKSQMPYGLSLNPSHCIRLLLTLILFVQIGRPMEVFQSPVAPTLPKEARIPPALSKQYVFLSEDEKSVVIALPDSSDGSHRKLTILPIHNQFTPTVGVDIQQIDKHFQYTYQLKTDRLSVDTVTTFEIVVSPEDGASLIASKEPWKSMSAKSVIAQRIGLPEAPKGCFLVWLSPSDEALKPGSMARFSARSDNRPGFTTAYMVHFPPISISPDWPPEVLDQLDPVADPAWIDKHVITFGPRYPADTSDAKIAEDYLYGIRMLQHGGALQSDSPFVKAVVLWLTQIKEGHAKNKTATTSQPTSEIEIELKKALALCFLDAKG